jgi:hypothetical protein
MTGFRIAASPNGIVRWALQPEIDGEQSIRREPRVSGQPRHPYRQIFAVLARHTIRHPEGRVCPRCGQPPHNDWGHEYERLVCTEITVA